MDEHDARAHALDNILFATVLGCALGILAASILPSVHVLTVYASIAAGICLSGAFLFQKQRRMLCVAAICMFALMLGANRFDAAKPNAERFADAVDTKVSVRGIVASPPQEADHGETFTLDAGDVSMLVSANGGDIAYGDEVTVMGKLELPENFETDQGTEFDYVSYLYKDNILYKMSFAQVSVLSHGHGNWLVAHLIPVKEKILASFNRVLPAKDADLLAGLNIGEKSSIDDRFRDDLVTTGTIHIIALSGYNVTVVANALRDLFVDVLGLSVRVAAISGGVCIILFVVMTGLQSSAVRAGIMALVGLFARGKGRTYDAFRALVFAGFLMIIWDPKYLVYDVSFQLSFLATLGIIFITPVLERAFARIPKKILFVIPIRELMSVTLGAQFGVLPFILYKMGTLSLIALPANILVLPAIPFAMGLGALAGFIGVLSVPLAYPVSYVTHLMLAYITNLITFFARVPYAAVVFHHFPLWLCFGMYTLLILIVYWQTRAYSEKNILT